MNATLLQAQQFIQYAREALRSGDRGAARRWAEQAAELAPQLEDPWLILAAVASPRASVTFIQRALQINPDSPRALQGMQWALKRLQEKPSAEARPVKGNQAPVPARSGGIPKTTSPHKVRRMPVYPILLLALGCLVVLFAAWTAGANPALASILGGQSQAVEQEHPPVWAQVEIAKPTYTPQPAPELAQAEPTLPPPTPTSLPATQAGNTLESAPTSTPQPDPTNTPELAPTAAPEIAITPGQLALEVLPDTPTPVAPPTSEYTAPTAKPQEQPQPVAGNGARWIDINLSEQRLYAYEGDVAVNVFIVSTGTWAHPTVTGTFKIWNKTRVQDMSGPGYYLPNVPYVMYFYKDYGIHGTYWHNNFGTPMSHGCVNLTIPDAEWLYYWAYEGMTVRVHY
jgi:lipoprotein-anchoring transpeptidase ErfK/SrfK